MSSPDTQRPRRFSGYSRKTITIEEGWGQKPRQRSSRLIGGGEICSISCRASSFASVYLEETVEGRHV